MIYFTSDAHLGSHYHPDPLAVERRLVAWLDAIAPSAEAIYFLGDMFDYWFEYRHVVPRGYVRFLGKVAELVDRGVEVYFFQGNHDVWMGDYLEREIGAKVLSNALEVRLGKAVFRLAHGDEEYRRECWVNNFMYRLFRAKWAQCLYAAVHPRWTVGLALFLSEQSRRRGLKRAKTPHEIENPYFHLEEEWLVRWVKQHLIEYAHVDYFVFGHRHLLADMALEGKRRLLILGDWLQYSSYAVWDGETLSLETFDPNSNM